MLVDLSEKAGERIKRGAPIQLPDVEILIGTLFAALAIAFGDHWELTQDECELLAAPVSGIASRQAVKIQKQIKESADYGMLLLALVVIITPRVQVSLALRRGDAEGGIILYDGDDDQHAGAGGDGEDRGSPAVDEYDAGSTDSASPSASIHARREAGGL